MGFETPDNLASPTGATLALRRAQPTGQVRAILLIEHGLAEHAGRYARFAEAMAARGLAVYAHDHRGHGLTQAGDAPLGRFAAKDGVDAVLADCAAVADHAVKHHPGLPMVVFGHSMGGLIALNFAETWRGHLAGLAVWNANFERPALAHAARAILAVERLRLGSDVPSHLLRRMTFETWGRSVAGRRTDLDWLSRKPDEVDAYAADPLCGFAPSVSMWRDVFDLILKGQDRNALARLRPDLPIHCAGGGNDPATDNGRAIARLEKRLRRAGLSDVTLRIDPDARHETLNDIGAEAAIADFAGWIDRILAPR